MTTPIGPSVAPVSTAPVSTSIDVMNRIITIGENKFRVNTLRVDGKLIDLSTLDNQSFVEIVGRFALEFLKNTSDNQRDAKHITVAVHADNKASLLNGAVEKTHDLGDLNNQQQTQIHEIKRRALVILGGTEAVKVKNTKFDRNIPSRVAHITARAAVIAGTVLASPIILLGVAGGHIVRKIIDWTGGIRSRELRTAAIESKEEEEQEKFNTLRALFLKEFKTPTKIQSMYDDTIQEAAKPRAILEKFLSCLTSCAVRSNHPLIQQDKTQVKFIEEWFHKVDLLIQDNKIDPSKLMENFTDLKTLRAYIKLVDPDFSLAISDQDLEEFLQASELLLKNPKEQRQIITQDFSKFQNFLRSYNTDAEDYPAANLQITELFREILNSPTYQAIKENPNNEFVKFLHRYAVAIYNDVTTVSVHQKLGETILNDQESEMVVPATQATTTVEIPSAQGSVNSEIEIELVKQDAAPARSRHNLRELHSRAAQHLMTDNGVGKVLYAFTHLKQSLGALTSLSYMTSYLAKTFGVKEFDPSGVLSNNPSLQGTTTAKIRTGNGETIDARVNNCYSGSPTIGDQVNPETLALLQAIENNNRVPALDRNPSIPNVLLYTNFQDIDSTKGEAERSFAIMHLATKYPNVFVGMTLAKDSDFYQMEGTYADAAWTSLDDFGTQMQNLLMGDDCYQYADRGKGARNGIYLPGGKEVWADVIPEIIAQANQHFVGMNDFVTPTQDRNKVGELRGAYQEYVYSMLQRYMETQLAVKHANEGKVLVMTIQACKENVDRGGSTNVKEFFNIHSDNSDALIDEYHKITQELGRKPHSSKRKMLEKDLKRITNALGLAPGVAPEAIDSDVLKDNFDKISKALLIGYLEGRPLSVRDRVILEHRLEAVLAYMKYVDPARFRNDVQTLMQKIPKLGVTISDLKFIPAYKVEKPKIPKTPPVAAAPPSLPTKDDSAAHEANPPATNDDTDLIKIVTDSDDDMDPLGGGSEI